MGLLVPVLVIPLGLLALKVLGIVAIFKTHLVVNFFVLQFVMLFYVEQWNNTKNYMVNSHEVPMYI